MELKRDLEFSKQTQIKTLSRSVQIIPSPLLAVYITSRSEFYRWESKGILPSESIDSRYIGIGLSRSSFPLTRLPGWEPDSWGYHGDDGNIFEGRGIGKPYGPTFTTGDTIGCCIDFQHEVVFYTINGQQLGIAFRHLTPGKVGRDLYPTIGLQTLGEHIKMNFGGTPFVFDIVGYVKVSTIFFPS
jgi:SPRY domain